MRTDEAVSMSFRLIFVLYYAIGFFVCLHATDRNGKPMPVWQAVFVAVVWPALFLMPFDDEEPGP